MSSGDANEPVPPCAYESDEQMSARWDRIGEALYAKWAAENPEEARALERKEAEEEALERAEAEALERKKAEEEARTAWTVENVRRHLEGRGWRHPNLGFDSPLAMRKGPAFVCIFSPSSEQPTRVRFDDRCFMNWDQLEILLESLE